MIRPYQRNDNFIGRATTVGDIKKALDPRPTEEARQATFALIGLGGVGKTQTALAYTFGSWDLFQAILWAQADTPNKLSQSFADFAYAMGLVDNPTDQTQARSEVKRWFETTSMYACSVVLCYQNPMLMN